MAWTRKLEKIEQKFLACEQAVQPSGPPSKKRAKKRKVGLQATREENPEMAELAALLQISHFQRVCQHINYKYLQQVNCHKMKVVLAIKKHFYFFLRFQEDCLFKLQFSNLMVGHYYTRKRIQ